MSKRPILIVEDDPTVLSMLQAILDVGGFAHESAATAREARAKIEQGDHELVLLDLSLPDVDGAELIGFVRERGDIPILVISGAAAERRRIDALDRGADDFIPKPFLPGELLARIRAARRRPRMRREAGAGAGFAFDPARPYARVRGEEVMLSGIEHRLLSLLTAAGGEVVTRRELCEELWGAYDNRTRRILYVTINRLRKRIEADPANPQLIVGAHGIGYRLAR